LGGRVVFERDAIARAVDLQARSYLLLRWMTDAIDRGFIAFGDAHEFASLSAATSGWIDRHYADLPPAARPPRDDLRPFCNLFATYLESSFELLEDPGMRHCGCDCYCCGTLVAIPRLKLKKLTPQDRRRGRALQVRAVKQLALDLDRTLSDEASDELLTDRAHHEAAGLVAYAHDLARRLDGVTGNPATLVLWRSFAWDEVGAPKPSFKLTEEMVLGAEAKLVAAIIVR
jgi:hypothetical protein